jgi:ABC-type branched-subunit amino acid transport system substrate-binding protein
VTDTTVKIGVGLVDIKAFEPVLGEQAAFGDQERHFQIHLDALRKQGVLPICGRDIVPVFRTYSILDPSQSRSVCQAFINDDQVFAVLTQFAFGDPNCVTQENKTVLIDHGLNTTLDNFAASGGRLYGLHPPLEEAWRIWGTWAATEVIQGRTVGVYYNNSQAGTDERVKTGLIDVLRAHGVDPVIATSDSNISATAALAADPNDLIAVQRFRAAGVQVVMRINTAFAGEAQRQGYRPLYLQYGTGAKDATSGNYDPAYMDGTLGVQWDQAGEAAGGEPLSDRAESCMKDLDEAGMARPHREWAESDGSLLACDLPDVLTTAMKAAGTNLTSDRLALGIQQIKNMPTSLVAPLTFGPDKHWGINEDRNNQYFGDCKCWKNIGPWRSLDR